MTIVLIRGNQVFTSIETDHLTDGTKYLGRGCLHPSWIVINTSWLVFVNPVVFLHFWYDELFVSKNSVSDTKGTFSKIRKMKGRVADKT